MAIGWSLIVPFLVFLAYYESQDVEKPIAHSLNKTIVLSDSIRLINFEVDVVPILKSHCSPCHFPGGKMYDRMPFDNSKTMVGHRVGILKRFKEPDLSLVKAYLDQEKL